MKFEDDFDNNGGGFPLIYTALGVSAFILLVLGIVVFVNNRNKPSAGNYQMLVAAREDGVPVEDANSEEEQPVHKRTADDLDFWDMYPQEYETADMAFDARGTDYLDEIDDTDEPEPTPDITPKTEEENFDDGLHYKIEYADGSSEWMKTDESIPLNNYDLTNVQISDGKMRYYLDGREASRVGIDISKYQGDIDFNQVKNAGIQFVMIRVGQRGYQTGELTYDDYFEKNLTGAMNAGLDVGVYFYSQAITANEAIEETNMVRSALRERQIKYPVAFVMEPAANDKARTDSLTKDERTQVAISFMNNMKANGYKTILYGSEEWLTKKLDLKRLQDYSFWLDDETVMSDYPYQYSMWRYSGKGLVPGINGEVNMDISFVDYTAQ